MLDLALEMKCLAFLSQLMQGHGSAILPRAWRGARLKYLVKRTHD